MLSSSLLRRTAVSLALTTALSGSASLAWAEDTSRDTALPPSTDESMVQKNPQLTEFPMVGGAAMLPSRDIVENAMKSNEHTTLVAAVKHANLVDTLKSDGPFTVFAPTNEAFDALPAGTVDTLLKPERLAQLTQILTYHVVPGRLDSADLTKLMRENNGKATLKTVEGENLMVSGSPDMLVVEDAKGQKARVSTRDVYQKNGVIFVIDKVLMPAEPAPM